MEESLSVFVSIPRLFHVDTISTNYRAVTRRVVIPPVSSPPPLPPLSYL